MSEHYDFHYQPTGSGAISGQQVLEQTEDAINELGDYVNDNVGGAMDVAQQALETAQNAEQDAQTALDTANSFSSAIQSAQQDASTALSTAQTAQNTASNANNTAIQASQDASSAVTTANNASGQVSTLSGTVTTLGQRVTTAEGNIGQNTSDISSLTTRVGTAEGNITTLQNDVTIAQGNASSAMATAGQVKQQAFVFRYSSTALVASSTNSNALLDNTDNLKVGDKVIDSSGVLFSITAIDTANSTFTIGTALIDLALDANVVHTSGNETVGGSKTFTNDVTVNNSNATVQADTPNLILKNPLVERASTTLEGEQAIIFSDKNNDNIASIKAKTYTSGMTDIILTSSSESSDQSEKTTGIVIRRTPTTSKFHGYSDNITSLGDTNRRWKSVYAMNYYYGNDNVEFSSKFVTTDTAQTISGAKTFSEDIVINNSDTSQNSKRLVITSSKVNLGDSNSDSWGISFNAGASYSALINSKKSTSSTQDLQFTVRTKDTSNNLITADYRLRINANGTAILEPTQTDYISLGSSANRWKDVQTNLINGLTPSSLSLPATTGTVDISSYVTDLTGNTVNTYSPVANGYIVITCNSTDVDYIKMSNNLDFVSVVDNTNNQFTSGLLGVWQPCVAGIGVQIRIKASALNSARFIPCQGNV